MLRKRCIVPEEFQSNKDQDMDKKMEEQKERMDRIIEWVKTCDTKTSIMLSLTVLVTSLLIGNDYMLNGLQQILSNIFGACKNPSLYGFSLSATLALTAMLCCLYLVGSSLLHFIRVLSAKTDPKQTRDDLVKTDSLIHFKSIADIKTYNEFKSRMMQETDDEKYEDLLSQTYINAKRCEEKFEDYNIGLNRLVYAMVACVVYIGSMVVFMS